MVALTGCYSSGTITCSKALPTMRKADAAMARQEGAIKAKTTPISSPNVKGKFPRGDARAPVAQKRRRTNDNGHTAYSDTSCAEKSIAQKLRDRSARRRQSGGLRGVMEGVREERGQEDEEDEGADDVSFSDGSEWDSASEGESGETAEVMGR